MYIYFPWDGAHGNGKVYCGRVDKGYYIEHQLVLSLFYMASLLTRWDDMGAGPMYAQVLRTGAPLLRSELIPTGLLCNPRTINVFELCSLIPLCSKSL